MYLLIYKLSQFTQLHQQNDKFFTSARKYSQLFHQYFSTERRFFPAGHHLVSEHR